MRRRSGLLLAGLFVAVIGAGCIPTVVAPPPPPGARISPNYLDYGFLTYPGQYDRRVVVKNVSHGAYQYAVTVNGINFRVASTNCNRVLQPGQTCSAIIRVQLASNPPLGEFTGKAHAQAVGVNGGGIGLATLRYVASNP